MYYDLIDEHLQAIYIKTFKWMSIITLILLPILIGLAVLFLNVIVKVIIIVLASIDCVLLVIGIIKYKQNIIKYKNRIKIENNSLYLENYQGKQELYFDIKNIKYNFISVGFKVNLKMVYKKCLVVYQNIDVYKKMKYSDYFDNKNIIIIQNKKAINDVFKILV